MAPRGLLMNSRRVSTDVGARCVRVLSTNSNALTYLVNGLAAISGDTMRPCRRSMLLVLAPFLLCMPHTARPRARPTPQLRNMAEDLVGPAWAARGPAGPGGGGR